MASAGGGIVDLFNIAKEITNINRDIIRRRRMIEDYYLYDFDQSWASTALGFGGVGGDAMTTARTYILIPKNEILNISGKDKKNFLLILYLFQQDHFLKDYI